MINLSKPIAWVLVAAAGLLLPSLTPAAQVPAMAKTELIQSEGSFDLSILGEPLATKEQCIRYMQRVNPFPLITVPIEALVEYYWQQGLLENIRPDVAFAQAIHETGHFRYGGDVVPLQNNYAGIGTTGNKVRGHWFGSAQEGVTAQMQHLLAYASTAEPQGPIVDPRYQLVKTGKNFGQAITWTDLNGRWAVPGKTYGQKILKIHARILEEDK